MVEDNINVIVIHSKKYLSQYVLSYKKIFLISTIVYTFFQPTQSGAIRAQTTKVPKKNSNELQPFFFLMYLGGMMIGLFLNLQRVATSLEFVPKGSSILLELM